MDYLWTAGLLRPKSGGAGEPYPGYDWYVDSVNGLDTNAGTSSTAALKTIAALEAKTIQAGIKIGLAKNSHWREQLDITVANVTVEAYGASGTAPVLDASDVVAAGGWSKTDGQTNVYQASVNADIAASKTWVNAWEDDVFLTRVANLATCDATPGSYLPSADTGAPGAITIYIHPTGSTNPTSDGKTYEVTVRQYALNARDATGTIVTGIETRRNLHEDGSAIFGRSSVVTNCTFSDGSKHNTLCNDGTIYTDCVANEAYYGDGSGTLYVYNEATPADLGIVYRRCTATLTSFSVKMSGFFGHNNVSGTFGAVTFDDCLTENLNVGFSGNNATQVIVSNSVALNCKNSVRINDGDWQIVDSLLISNVDNQRHFDILGAATITANRMSICSQAATSGGAIYGTAVATVTLSDCKFAIVNAATRRCIALPNADTTLSVDGCHFGTGWSSIYFNTTAPIILSNNNCFNSEPSMRHGATTYSSLSSWSAATGQDADSDVGGCDTSGACS